MKRILVAVDFSTVSVNALQYALNLCKTGDKIDILHVQTGLYSTSETPTLAPLKQSEEETAERIKNFFETELGLEKFPVNVSISVETGEIVNSIIRYSAGGGGFSFIVMGTRDKYHFLDKWFGTISLGIVKRSAIPVLLVPRHAIFKGFDNAIVAGDIHLANSDSLKALEAWNEAYTCQLHFIHVNTGEPGEFKNVIDTIVREYYENHEVDFSFDISHEEGKKVTDTLLIRAKEKAADIIILFPEKQTYVSALLFDSVSKDLILKSVVPMLFMKI